MRAILGKPDCPDSSYILVLRGPTLPDTLDYYYYHVKRYPTWGCLVFPEEGEILSELEDIVSTPIHRVFTKESYTSVSDAKLIQWVKECFPPFSEDDIESSRVTDKLDVDCIEVPPSGKMRRFDSHRVIPAVELRHAFDSLVVENGISACKSEIFRRIFEIPELWDINLYEDPHGDKHIHVSLIVRDAVSEDRVGPAMGFFGVPADATSRG